MIIDRDNKAAGFARKLENGGSYGYDYYHPLFSYRRYCTGYSRRNDWHFLKSLLPESCK